ncbi:MAG: GGDEF domain-containing protein [Acidimicrobiales bacterium]
MSDWHTRAIYDPMTGLRNRASLSDSYQQLAAFDDRNLDPQMAALMVDVDHFKVVNDTFGHAAGDLLLQRIAHALLQSVRPSDPSFRLGGEEFLVLLSNVDASSARHAAERIRERVAGSAPDLPIVTVSVGLALRQRNETQESLLARADEALYRAKENGRDRVEGAP